MGPGCWARAARPAAVELESSVGFALRPCSGDLFAYWEAQGQAA
eukprot:CAMPEP_0204467102 /NCGR_PEP_ID=MMETSP0471-20130131/9583_1 /ASSEMBLY_ACC=CAM_ASM_000602 /TAXON_ID=2969 /ORGANISM="Oxyrrhis marina" /LENGTH=43 /DNA_ID= /DNA_START= /DNA_END= /DNA_ORIENTATION=